MSELIHQKELEKLQIAFDQARKEAERWKANHACEVDRARVLKERPDMPLERIKAYDRMKELEEENKRLRAQIESLRDRQYDRDMLNMVVYTSRDNDYKLHQILTILNNHFR